LARTAYWAIFSQTYLVTLVVAAVGCHCCQKLIIYQIFPDMKKEKAAFSLFPSSFCAS
jgi:hypothetical protein